MEASAVDICAQSLVTSSVHMLSSTFKRSLNLSSRSLRTFHSTARIMGVDVQVGI